MEIIHFFPSDYAAELQSKLSNKEGKMFLVCIEYSSTGVYTDFEGLDIALELDTQEMPLIVCSVLPATYFMSEDKLAIKFQALLARKKTCFVQLGDLATEEEWYEKYTELLLSNKAEDAVAIALHQNDALNQAISRIRHDYSRYFTDSSEEGKAKTLEGIAKAREAGLSGSNEEILDQIMNFQCRSNNSIFAGQFFPGVFCDIEGTLFAGGSLNAVMLKTLQDESETKPITLWTGGDLKTLQERLLQNNITWKLLSKYDFAGAEVEIAYDDDDQATLLSTYNISVRDFRSPRHAYSGQEASLMLLHELLTPAGAEKALLEYVYKEILSRPCGITQLKQLVERLVEIDAPLDEEYLQILKKIRDFLLKE